LKRIGSLRRPNVAIVSGQPSKVEFPNNEPMPSGDEVKRQLEALMVFFLSFFEIKFRK